MTLLSILLLRDEKKDKLRSVFFIIFIVLLVLSLFLCYKDTKNVGSRSTKFWLYLMAIVFPDLYVILHGIQTSSMNSGFFSSSPSDFIAEVSGAKFGA